MTNLTQKAVAAIIAVVGITAAGQPAKAASFKHIDRLAVQLASQSKQLSVEFRAHYSHMPHYRHLMSDTAGVRRLANHIHEVAHRGSLSHMSADLRKLDRSFHHLEGLVNEIERDAYAGPYGHGGHKHGETSHVRRIMRRMENTLHHLRTDVNEMLHPAIHDHGHDRDYNHGYYTPRYRSRGRGFSYRNGNFRIRIGH